MLKSSLTIALFALACMPGSAIGEFFSMDPAPADRPFLEQSRKPGDIKKDKYGLPDPTPDVISLTHLPKDRYGFVDWAEAISTGVISPKSSIDGLPARLSPVDRERFDGDVLIRSGKEFMPDVLFPHSAHNEWLKCSTCHPRIFSKKAGASRITMTGIWKGRFCGVCHDKVAFPTRNCFKCHSVRKDAGK